MSSSTALIIDYELFTMSLPLIMQNFKAVIPHLRLYFHYLPEGRTYGFTSHQNLEKLERLTAYGI